MTLVLHSVDSLLQSVSLEAIRYCSGMLKMSGIIYSSTFIGLVSFKFSVRRFVFVRAVKSSFFELSHKGRQVPEKANKVLTRTLLGLLTTTALFLEDAGIVVSLNGAVMGSAIIYAFPSIIFLKLTSRLMAEGRLDKTRGLMIERLVNKGLIGIGGSIAVLGAAVILLNKFKPGLI